MRFGRTALTAAGVVSALVLTSCASPGEGEGVTTITVAGPNQWNSQTDSFGDGWDALIASFEDQNPDVKVKTNVLPGNWAETLSTWLSAGTAPELIFNQAPHSPDQVVALDDYLTKPNPYIPESTAWIDDFNQQFFGRESTRARNAKGNYEWVPFNLITTGLFYNADLLAEVGVDAAPETFGELIETCDALDAAGYRGLSMDNGPIAPSWTSMVLLGSLLAKYTDEFNVYDIDGDPGTAPELTEKSRAAAFLTGKLDPTTTPEFGEALRLLKEMVDHCATDNWSGVTPAGGLPSDFANGEAAMLWGSNFSAPLLDAVSFKWSTMPFPTVAESDSPYSDGTPSQFGLAPGGTSYMIPATTTGEKLDASVRFMQFITSANGQEWLDSSGGIPSTVDAKPAPGLEGLTAGEWGTVPAFRDMAVASKSSGYAFDFSGYLLGTRSLDDQLSYKKGEYIAWAEEKVDEGGWTEDWAQR